MTNLKSTPTTTVTLAIGGHDPSGGAGVQADIESIVALGGYATSTITCLTVQDTCNVQQLIPVASKVVIAQAEAVLADLPVSAIKIGLIGNAEVAHALAQLLEQHPSIPVVVDPVLAAGGGTRLASEKLRQTLLQELLPLTYLLTPNSQEARALAGKDNLNDCAEILLQRGCRHLLITGTHEENSEVINSLYGQEGEIKHWQWPRLPNEYHGSGCTLAAAIATLLAQGESLTEALYNAQDFAWQSLLHAHQKLGRGQALPDRLYQLRQQLHG